MSESGLKVAAPAAGIERRASTRYPCSLATSCRLAALVHGDSWPARVRNISVGGVSLVLSHPVDANELLSLELRSNCKDFVRTLVVRALYTVEHPSGDWIIGGSFVDPLNEDELHAFLS